MAFGISGLAARGAGDSLDQLLVQQLQREALEQQRADTERRFAQQDRNLDLQQRDAETRANQFERAQAADERRFALAEGDAAAKAERSAYEDTARRNMSELVNDPTQLAAFALASGVDVPKWVSDITKPKEAKLHQVTIAGPGGQPMAVMKTEEEMRAGVPVYREPKEPKAPKEEPKQWLMRGGREVYDTYQPGDTRATSTGSNSTTPEQQRKAQQTLTTVIDRVKALSGKINTVSDGLGAKLQGGYRQGKAMLGMDNDINEYQALLDSAIPFVARAYGHTGVLTQQDVDSVRKAFPSTGDNADLRIRKLKNAEAILLGLVDRGEEAVRGATPAPSHEAAPGGAAQKPKRTRYNPSTGGFDPVE